jgi:hypothetical protein
VTHPSDEAIADFARGLLQEAERETLQRHFDLCESCREQVRLLARVSESASRDCEVPADVLRRAVAIFPQAVPEPSRLRRIAALLAFDSYGQPALAGLRSAAVATRRLVFTTEDCRIEILIDRPGAGDRMALTGQVSFGTAARGKSVEIALAKGRRVLQRTVSQASGEFHLDAAAQAGLRLRVTDPFGGREVEVLLPAMN